MPWLLPGCACGGSVSSSPKNLCPVPKLVGLPSVSTDILIVAALYKKLFHLLPSSPFFFLLSRFPFPVYLFDENQSASESKTNPSGFTLLGQGLMFLLPC